MKWLDQHPGRAEQLHIGTTERSTAPHSDVVVLEADTDPPVDALGTPDHQDVVALLVDCGVEPVVANRYVASVVKNPDAGTFWEVYGKGNLANAALRQKDINVVGLRVLDLRSSRPDGEHWDFTRKTDRRWAMKLVE